MQKYPTNDVVHSLYEDVATCNFETMVHRANYSFSKEKKKKEWRIVLDDVEIGKTKHPREGSR